MKELVIKKDSDRVDVRDILDKYEGIVLFKRQGKFNISDFCFSKIFITYFLDGGRFKSYEYDNKDRVVANIVQSDSKIFTCNSFDEAYQLMLKMNGEGK